MGEDLYKVVLGNDVFCEKIRLADACLVVQAVMEKYYADPEMKVTVERMGRKDDQSIRSDS